MMSTRSGTPSPRYHAGDRPPCPTPPAEPEPCTSKPHLKRRRTRRDRHAQSPGAPEHHWIYRLGHAKAKELALTGKPLSGREAVARRDGLFGDYSQAPKDEQPDPDNVIRP